jgi:TIR domain
MFKYSCFLSYQRGNELLDRFVREIFQELSNELGLVTSLPVWFDTARLITPESWTAANSQELLRSVCIVPILTPTYFSRQRTYCIREYLTMERIEVLRSRATGRQESLIFPVVLRGSERLPKIVSKRQYLDFSSYLAFAGKQFRSPGFQDLIFQLAHQISTLCARATQLEKSVDFADLKAALLSDQEASQWFESGNNDIGEGANFPRFGGVS